MGKPYAEEIGRLPVTYSWSRAASVDALSRAIRVASAFPLVAVGSGGSFTAAKFVSGLHREYTSGFATAMTPLQAVFTPQSFRTSAVLLLSAAGSNPDVLDALTRIVAREPRRTIVLCMRKDSPLGRLASKVTGVDLTEFDLPSGRDGFLATNSLMATGVLAFRAYAEAFGTASSLPPTFSALLGGDEGTSSIDEIDRRCRILWERRTLVALYGPDTQAAAVDLESKFTEAALGSVQLADYRNFAHGRHHWLAKRADESAVLAITTDTDREIAESVLGALPPELPVVRLKVPGRGAAACLAAVAGVLAVVRSAGVAKGIDPGNPGVPPFGRQIFRMRSLKTGAAEICSGIPPRERAAIERKSGATLASLIAQRRLDEWRTAYREFCTRLSHIGFPGLVLDYDGTLCDEAHRFGPLPAVIARQLNRLLEEHVVVGIATGRGKSAKAALRDALDKRLWNRVVIGYYNGADIGLLADDTHPDPSEAMNEDLAALANELKTNDPVVAMAKLTFRRWQITVEPHPGVQSEHLWSLLQHIIHTRGASGIAALRSSHSIDLVGPRTSKRAVMKSVRELINVGPDAAVLCIGDRGRWPGNDFSLLSGPYSLSVDEVSPDPHSCWNLAAPGQRGLEATTDYFEHLEVSRTGLLISFK